MKRKLAALIGIAMIGEGVAAATRPRRYVQVWAWPSGPQWYTGMIRAFRQRPDAVVGLAVLEGVAGMALVLAAERDGLNRA